MWSSRLRASVSPGSPVGARLTLLGFSVLASSCTQSVVTAPREIRQPAVTRVMARQVQNAMDAGEGDLEAKNLRQRLAARPDDLDARILLARHYAKRGLPDLALEHYRLAAARFPNSLVAEIELVKTLRDLRAPAEALKEIDAALARNPSWELLSLKGVIEDDQGRLQDAEASHRAALARESSRSSLHNNLGYNLLLQGKAEAAADEFRRAIEIDPNSTIARNNLASALALQSQPQEALAEWRRFGDAATAHNNLAVSLMEQGRWQEARAELELALAAKRDFPEALANLRLVAEQDGKAPSMRPASIKGFWKRVADKFAVESEPKATPSKAAGEPAASPSAGPRTAASRAR